MNISKGSIVSDTPIQIIHPQPKHIASLRILWKEAFGDTDAFLDVFFSTAFAPERCLCILIKNNITAALYWFECEYSNHPLAYIYAVATAKAYRGRGLCRQLLAATHSTLTQQGYIGALLVPGNETLFDFYKKAGYQTTCYRHIYQYNQNAGVAYASTMNQAFLASHTGHAQSISDTSTFLVKQISATEYASLRKNFLPPDSVFQEKETIAFLQTQLKFYSGENFLAAVAITEQKLYCPELLYTDTIVSSKNIRSGNSINHDLMSQLLSYFGCINGIFCSPGGNSPFAMYYSLNTTIKAPKYFAFAFD